MSCDVGPTYIIVNICRSDMESTMHLVSTHSALFAEFHKDLAPNSEYKNNFRAFRKKSNGELDTLRDPKRWIGNLVEDTPFYKRFEQVAADVIAAVGDTFGNLEVPKGDMARDLGE
eukprot:gene19631-23480_t